jgi:hypothetical protein
MERKVVRSKPSRPEETLGRHEGAEGEGDRARPPRRDAFLTLRVPAEFDRRLEEFLAGLQGQQRWGHVTKSDVLRWLLEDGLERLAAQDGERERSA